MISFFATSKWKRVSHILYSWGAAIVILGALFKLAHFSMGFLTGELMLWIGLLTEASIFFISGLETPNKEYDWSLVYPELVGLEVNRSVEQSNVLAQMNELFANGKISSDVFTKLATGINQLESTASQLNNVSDAALATNKYVESMNGAAAVVTSLSKVTKERLNAQEDVQRNMGEVLDNLSISLENSKSFKQQTGELTQNLSALNRVYGNMLSAMNVSK